MADPAFAVRLGKGREFDRIRQILDDADPAQASAQVRVGPGDDAAVLVDGTVLSTDLAVEGIHFRFDWMSPEAAGYRTAAGGVSDLAAMAAEPVGILVSLAVPGDGSMGAALMRGVNSLAREVGAVLLGGDLTRSPGPCVLDVVSVGRTTEPLLRSGASSGDELWVTGSLGGAAGAVLLLQNGRPVPDPLLTRFLEPRPRTREARWLMEAGASGGLDLSDGIAGDTGHMAAASEVGIVLESAALPIDPALRTTDLSGLELALHGGEDYELVVAAPPGRLGPRVGEFTKRFGLPLTRVGRVVDGTGVWLLSAGAERPRPLGRGGFDHFSPADES